MPRVKAKRGPNDPKRGPMPTKLDKFQQVTFIGLIRKGIGRTVACSRMDVNFRFFQRTMREDADFRQAVHSAERGLEELALTTIFAAFTHPEILTDENLDIRPLDIDAKNVVELRLRAASLFLKHRLTARAMAEARAANRERRRQSDEALGIAAAAAGVSQEDIDRARAELQPLRKQQADAAWAMLRERGAQFGYGEGMGTDGAAGP